jgi:hypothetical protein
MPYFDQAGDRTTLKQMTTTLKLSHEEVLGLLDSLEGQHLHLLDEDEIKTHDRLTDRLTKALRRLEA